jgi:glycosyltransferase involved in cell wall biosynthesis
MRIAIQAADLDHPRIDGTRVYILSLLRRFGTLSPQDEFIIYHKNNFNPELVPPDFANYLVKKIKSPMLWTQTRLAYELSKDKPDVLWMPMHNLPIINKALKNRKTDKPKIIVTIHDLAFKIFPDHFPKKDLMKLNLLTGLAVKYADKIITISESSKKDILKFYPRTKAEKIKVIYHGFDAELFSAPRNINQEKELKRRLGIEDEYILYTGAIQPRKNLETLIRAYEICKKRTPSRLKLVLAGEKAWMWENIEKLAQSRSFSGDIIMPGKLKFCDLGPLMRGASLYAYPSLYEGFGITILEAMASSVPVICSHNSSLPEVGSEAVLYFSDNNAEDLALKIEKVLGDEKLRRDLVAKGREQIKKFSWDQCARETLEFIKGAAEKEQFPQN